MRFRNMFKKERQNRITNFMLSIFGARTIEEGRGLSDRSGNFGYPRHRDTVAAILQKADESSPAVSCLSCFQCTASFLCFQEIKVFAGTRKFFNCAVVIISIVVQYTTFDFNCYL
jgi:hypothetical protein